MCVCVCKLVCRVANSVHCAAQGAPPPNSRWRGCAQPVQRACVCGEGVAGQGRRGQCADMLNISASKAFGSQCRATHSAAGAATPTSAGAQGTHSAGGGVGQGGGAGRARAWEVPQHNTLLSHTPQPHTPPPHTPPPHALYHRSEHTTLTRQYSSQQAFPTWEPACPKWMEMASRMVF